MCSPCTNHFTYIASFTPYVWGHKLGPPNDLPFINKDPDSQIG